MVRGVVAAFGAIGMTFREVWRPDDSEEAGGVVDDKAHGGLPRR
jgi:hypothetical protein